MESAANGQSASLSRRPPDSLAPVLPDITKEAKTLVSLV